MRSRPELTVLLSPGAPRPGDTLEVEARFDSKTETPLDKVEFDLIGVETVVVQQGKSSQSWRHEHVHQKAEVPGRPLTPGQHVYRARFKLPVELPPQYWGKYTTINYILEVRAHIPWWPDRVGRYSVPVQQLPMNAPEKPGVFVSEYGGAKTGELYAEMSLASTVAEPGGRLDGTVALTNARGERGVRVALVACERLFPTASFFQGGSLRETLEVRRWAHTLANVAPEEGRGLPFHFAIAPDTVPTFTAAISAVEWAVEVLVERTFSHRTLLRAPVLIVPRTSAARRAPPAPVPAVGHERRAQSFQTVAARAGLAYDPEHGDLRGSIGVIGLRIAVETRPDGQIATVAHLTWPSLGMAFRLGPTSWTDWLDGRRVDIPVPDFDRRYRVQARVPEQARALLDPALCTLLLGFQEARLDDEGATFAVPLALVDEAPLADLVLRTVETARTLDGAFPHLPVPPRLAPHEPAWRAAAARLGGRFDPARGAITEATSGLERVEILTTWLDDARDREAVTTTVHVPLGATIDPDAISPTARAQITALADQEAAHITVTSDTVTATLDRLTPDPATLDPLLEGLLRLAHSVRGRGAAGPFRS